MKQAGWLCYAYEYKLIPICNPSFNRNWRGLLNIRLRCTTALKLHGVKDCLQPFPAIPLSNRFRVRGMSPNSLRQTVSLWKRRLALGVFFDSLTTGWQTPIKENKNAAEAAFSRSLVRLSYSIFAFARKSSWNFASFCCVSCWVICGFTSSNLGNWASRTSSRRMMW